jgi:hypothetical protein
MPRPESSAAGSAGLPGVPRDSADELWPRSFRDDALEDADAVGDDVGSGEGGSEDEVSQGGRTELEDPVRTVK